MLGIFNGSAPTQAWHSTTDRTSDTAENAVEWTEFILVFVQGSVVCTSPGKPQDNPPNDEGLRQLMSGVRPQPGSTILTRGEAEKRLYL